MTRFPFQEKELRKTGEYTMASGSGTVYKYDYPISPRENFVAAVKERSPVWLPNYYDLHVLCPACYPDAVARGFVKGPEEPMYMDDSKKGGKDSFDISWIYMPAAGGSMVRPGNPLLEDINDWRDKVHMPLVENWDWEGSKEHFRTYLETEDAVRVMWIFTGFFERMISLMDFENAAIALIDDEQKEAIHDFFSQCCDIYKQIIKHYKEDFDGDVLFFHDDWGSQRAPFFSAQTCMEMIVPHLKDIVDYTHSLGMLFEMHSCGKNESLVPCYLAAGIDLWIPQKHNDIEAILKAVDGKIAIGLGVYVDTDLSSEKQYTTGVNFAQKYCTDYEKHPVYQWELGDMDEKLREAIYVESRKIFSGCAQLV